jgi:hypothetical protein
MPVLGGFFFESQDESPLWTELRLKWQIVSVAMFGVLPDVTRIRQTDESWLLLAPEARLVPVQILGTNNVVLRTMWPSYWEASEPRIALSQAVWTAAKRLRLAVTSDGLIGRLVK